ncbi:hypothetical protein KPG71_04395 [Roseovarius sp. PS-C2]|uniref:hypothetical protein n=1 Tax=Roseovarius sp. PS-C2 TaxID=2820814 RepID=UPI001C0ADF11|nr:hypothetical protein [Roseovarius sp. PS-C2]MBU3259249.1 hypothetical protein [Roseovarius sp. PS-C2]
MVLFDSFHSPPPRDSAAERAQWRKEIMATAFQGGVTSDYWLEVLLDRVEVGR